MLLYWGWSPPIDDHQNDQSLSWFECTSGSHDWITVDDRRCHWWRTRMSLDWCEKERCGAPFDYERSQIAQGRLPTSEKTDAIAFHRSWYEISSVADGTDKSPAWSKSSEWTSMKQVSVFTCRPVKFSRLSTTTRRSFTVGGARAYRPSNVTWLKEHGKQTNPSRGEDVKVSYFSGRNLGKESLRRLNRSSSLINSCWTAVTSSEGRMIGSVALSKTARAGISYSTDRVSKE